MTVTADAPVSTSADSPGLANATFVMLARNSDLEGALSSIRSIQDRFNLRYGYPFVFLNDEDFSEDFKTRMSVLTGYTAQFGRVPPDHWNQPDFIDEEKASEARQKLKAQGVKYAGE